jgi:hypothetical protein
MLFLDGVKVEAMHGKLRFHRTKAPSVEELKALVYAISQRIAGFSERIGLLERDVENSLLTIEAGEEDAMEQFQVHSITYRISVGTQ